MLTLVLLLGVVDPLAEVRKPIPPPRLKASQRYHQVEWEYWNSISQRYPTRIKKESYS